jgi:hypothetical protein
MPLGAIPERNSLINIKSNMDLEQEAAEKRKIAEVDMTDPFMINLTTTLRQHWEAAKNNKWRIEERLLRCQRQRQGIYEPDDLRHIQAFGGSEIFMMLTNVKCRAIESWVKDVLLPAGEKPWSISPTPEPELPIAINDAVQKQVALEIKEIADFGGGDMSFATPEIVAQRVDEIRREINSRNRKESIREAELLEHKMDDQLTEGELYRELEKFIKDFATFPTAFLKGPIVRNKKVLVWEDDGTGKKKPVVKSTPRRYWKRVSPFDMYFAPGARHINDGYSIERIRLRRKDLQDMKGVEGFSDANIDAVLLEYNAGLLHDWIWTDQERANLENRPNELEDPESIIQALEYHGWASGRDLIEWGMDKSKIENPTDMYPISAVLIDRWVIMARLNANPLGDQPYWGASFDPQNDSIFGNAPPELMEDCQRVCNSSARAVVNNMAIASGPQVEVNYDRMKAQEDIEALYPWKIWRTKSDPMGKNREAVRFFQPDPMVQALLLVYDQFFKQAGEQLGVPAYEHGGQAQGGAGKTAHGLSMLMSASSKIMKDAITNIDTNVIKPLISDCFMHMMLYDEIEYNGDINIVARASEYLVIAEQLQIRRTEFLAMTNNPTDMQIIGVPGRAEILRETIKNLKLPSEDIVPDREEMERRQHVMEVMQQMQSEMDAMGGGQPGGGDAKEPAAPQGPSAPGISPDVEGSTLPPLE